MGTMFQRAFACATLGCIALAVAGCHDVSKEAGMAPALSLDPPAVATAVVSTDDGTMENDFDGEGEMQDEAVPYVMSIQPRLDTASADVDAVDGCKAWALTSEEAEAFFAMSHPVDARTWDEDYEDAPCAIGGTVRSDGIDWQFSINGAHKAVLRSKDDVRYLGCDSRECEQFSS